MIGRCFSHYRVLRLLSEGGMGSVYEAVDLTLERRVAIKVIRPPELDSGDALELFLREARAVSRVEHPNVVAIHDVLAEDGLHLLVMQYVDGAPLRERLRAGPMRVSEALRVAEEVTRGLQEAHRHGVVHRDVKPDNVMMTSGGTCKVLDFGVARLVDRTTVRDSGGLIGTVPYMSPEQVRGERVDARCDLYSVGVMMYEMLAGRLPWTSRETAPMLYEILESPVPALRDLRPDLPEDVERMVAHAMARSPHERYQSAEELLHDLEVIRDRYSEGASAADARLLARPRRGRRRLTLVLGALTVVASAAILYVALRSRAQGPEHAGPRLMVANWELSAPDSGSRWLASGVADYLIRSLAERQDLRVISRETARSAILATAPAGADPSTADVSRAARRLEARYLVTGTIQPRRGGARILCDLVSVRDGTLLRSWSQDVEGVEGGFYPAMETFSAEIARLVGSGRRRAPGAPRTIGEALTPSMAALRAYHEALLRSEAGDLPGMLAALRVATAADSGFADAQLLLARSSLDQAERQRALDAARAARGRASPVTRGLIDAQDKMNQGRFAEAGPIYESVLARDPENVVAGVALARLYGQQRRFADAAAAFEALHDVDPFDYSYYGEWALAYRDIQRDDRALAILQQWRHALPEEQAPLRSLIQMRQILGEYERGLVLCDTLDGLAAGAATRQRAQLLADLGRLHEARRLFQRLEVSPDPYAVATRGSSFLAVLALYQHDYDGGLRLLEPALRGDPGAYNWWLAGVLAAGAHRVPLARAYADSIAATLAGAGADEAHAFTGHRFLYHLRARIALEQDSARVAVGMMERALRNTARSDRPFFITDLGRALLAAGDAPRAARELEGMRQLNPRYPPGLLELGRAYLRLGRRPEARRVLADLQRIWSRADADYVLNRELHALLRSSETRSARDGHPANATAGLAWRGR